MSSPNRQKPNEALVSVRLTPKASNPRVEVDESGMIKAWVSAPPSDGQANEALINLMAKTLRIAKSAIEITAGQTHRNKTLRITGLSSDTVRTLIEGRD